MDIFPDLFCHEGAHSNIGLDRLGSSSPVDDPDEEDEGENEALLAELSLRRQELAVLQHFSAMLRGLNVGVGVCPNYCILAYVLLADFRTRKPFSIGLLFHSPPLYIRHGLFL